MAFHDSYEEQEEKQVKQDIKQQNDIEKQLEEKKEDTQKMIEFASSASSGELGKEITSLLMSDFKLDEKTTKFIELSKFIEDGNDDVLAVAFSKEDIENTKTSVTFFNEINKKIKDNTKVLFISREDVDVENSLFRDMLKDEKVLFTSLESLK